MNNLTILNKNSNNQFLTIKKFQIKLLVIIFIKYY